MLQKDILMQIWNEKHTVVLNSYDGGGSDRPSRFGDRDVKTERSGGGGDCDIVTVDRVLYETICQTMIFYQKRWRYVCQIIC